MGTAAGLVRARPHLHSPGAHSEAGKGDSSRPIPEALWQKPQKLQRWDSRGTCTGTMTQALPLLPTYGRTRMAGGQREGEHRGNRRNVGGYPNTGGVGQPQVGGGPKSTEGGEQDSREGSGGGGGFPRGQVDSGGMDRGQKGVS